MDISAIPGFLEFLEPGVDRLAHLLAALAGLGVQAKVLGMAGSRHVLVRFKDSAYTDSRRVKTLVAHYDREPGSRGANDNSAAVFQLVALAARLKDRRGRHNVQIVFTDNEEAPGRGSVRDQGSFGLAEGFRKLWKDSSCFIILDVTGRGDTYVLSASGLDLVRKSSAVPPGFVRELEGLHRILAWELAAAGRGEALVLPTPYSDNLGIILGGLPAAAITMLPRDEAYGFGLKLQENPHLRQAFLRPDSETLARMPRDALPLTWKSIHGPSDGIELLTEGAFAAMAALLERVVGMEVPLDLGKVAP